MKLGGQINVVCITNENISKVCPNLHCYFLALLFGVQKYQTL